ncbi:hypothetical protein F5888DRAFT_105128 [Russula emetica]|nr:hypothetical protein F5888DRAFT_105128 [Russula emetica]
MEFLHPHPRRLTHLTSHSLIDHTVLDEQRQQQQHWQDSRFPTSSDRLGWPARFPPEPPHPARYDPLGSLAQDEPTMIRKVLCSSFNPRFFPSHVARGVLSDGTWTTAHPSVHAFLQSPSSRPSLTSKTSAAIYSLAALHVFYSPSHPVYDAFWHPDIKESTAMFVHQVVTMKPSPISTAPMTWLGVHDMLWQLTGIQKEYFKSQGGKTSVQPLLPTRRSLRKRKPAHTREPSEVPEPPRKKNKISKPEEDEKGSEATTSVVLDQSDVSINNKAGPSELPHNKSTIPSSHETQGNVDVTPSPLTITSSLPPDTHSPAKDDVAQAGTSRGRSKDALGKKVQANSAPSRSSVRRTRERSPSFSSGSSTAVSAAGSNSKRARSSSSASSTSTTVVTETGTNSSKGKGKAKAVVAPEEETEEEEEDEMAGKRSTRTRRSSARDAAGSKPSRRQGGTTGLRSTTEIDKLVIAEARPRRVRSRSGVTSSRSRKSRKS